MRVAQRRAKQIGEVLDGLFRALRVAARQRRDRVHAVEQEVRADARLQRLDARLRFRAHVLLPLMRHEEVPQQQRRDDERDAGIAQQERPVLGGQLRDADGAEGRAEPQRELGDHDRVQQDQARTRRSSSAAP